MIFVHRNNSIFKYIRNVIKNGINNENNNVYLSKYKITFSNINILTSLGYINYLRFKKTFYEKKCLKLHNHTYILNQLI